MVYCLESVVLGHNIYKEIRTSCRSYILKKTTATTLGWLQFMSMVCGLLAVGKFVSGLQDSWLELNTEKTLLPVPITLVNCIHYSCIHIWHTNF